jgi:DNA polymerase epsilon subunit 3
MCFISSNDVAKGSNQKTITANHVFQALEIVELDHLIEPLKKSFEGKWLTFFFD